MSQGGLPMALHTAVVAIEGDHASRLPAILAEYGYQDATARGTYDTIDAASYAMRAAMGQDRSLSRFVTCVTQGWTLLFDREMTLAADDKACAKTSAMLRSRVFTMICEGVSSTYAYSLYDEGAKVRGFLAVGGEVAEDVGSPLGGESGLDKTRVFDTDVLAIMKSLGVDYVRATRSPPFSLIEAKFRRPGPELTPEQREAIAAEARKLVASVTVVRGSGEYSKASRQKALDEAAENEKKKGWKFWKK